MPTQVDLTVGDGTTETNDYSTIAACASALHNDVTNRDLPTGDENVFVTVYDEGNGTGGIYDATVVCDLENNGANSMTFDATHNVRFVAHQAHRHDGTSGNGVRITTSGLCINCKDDHTTFEGFTIERTGAHGFDGLLYVSGQSATVGVQFIDCVIQDAGNANEYSFSMWAYDCGDSSNPTLIQDCVFYDCTNPIMDNPFQDTGSWTHVVNIVNCSYVGCVTGVAIYSESGNTHNYQMVNQMAYNNSSSDYLVLTGSGTITTTGSTNNYGENSNWPGVGTPDPIDGTTVDAAGTDVAIYTSSTDANLVDTVNQDVFNLGVGTTNSLVKATDCLGNARGVTTCDPGAFQVSAVGGGDQSVTVPVVAVATLSILAPSISFDQTVAVPVSSASLAIVAPAQIDQTVDVLLASAALAIVAPDRVDRTTDVAASAATLTVLAPDRIDQTVDVPVESLAASVLAPSISAGQTVSVPVSSASLSVLAPSRIDRTVDVASASATLAVLAPAVSFDQTVAVPVSAATLAILAPGIVAGQVVAVPVSSAALSVLAPVRTDQTVAVSVESAALAVLAPARVDQEVAVGVASAALAIVAPTVTVDTGQTVAVPVSSAALTVLAPDRIDQTVDVAASSAALTVIAPTIGGDQAVAVPVSTATLAILAPAISQPGVGGDVGVIGAETTNLQVAAAATTLRVAAETTTLQVYAATTDDAVGVAP